MPLFCYSRSNADGAVGCFVSAGVAGGDRDTAVRRVVRLLSAKPIEKPKEDIERRKKAKRLIGRLKNAAGWGWVKKPKKFWMMQLQHSEGVALQCRFAD